MDGTIVSYNFHVLFITFSKTNENPGELNSQCFHGGG